MLDALYKDNQTNESEYLAGYDLTLIIDKSKLPTTQKVKKTMDEETQAKTKASNE
jgi:hypothetical protein